jgi:hypothetical protein
MKFQVQEVEAREELPIDAPLNARLLSIETKTVNYVDKKTNEPKSFDKLVWKFGADDFDNRWVWGETSTTITTHPENEFRNFVEALLGVEVNPDFSFTDDDLIGLRCQVILGHQPNKKDPANPYTKVMQVLPATESEEVPF